MMAHALFEQAVIWLQTGTPPAPPPLSAESTEPVTKFITYRNVLYLGIGLVVLGVFMGRNPAIMLIGAVLAAVAVFALGMEAAKDALFGYFVGGYNNGIGIGAGFLAAIICAGIGFLIYKLTSGKDGSLLMAIAWTAGGGILGAVFAPAIIHFLGLNIK